MTQENKSPSSWGIELSKLWLEAGMPFPIKPSEIILEVINRRFDDRIAAIKGHTISGIEGMLAKSKKANEWFILYDETVTIPGRINFTISHELGHYLLHRNLGDEFQCGQSTMVEYESVTREKEANEFASFLLMPINDFRNQIDGQEVTLDLIGHCATRYNVSITACTLKWIQFTSEVAIVVIVRDDFVLWSYPSLNARKLGVFFKQGFEIPFVAQTTLHHGGYADTSVRRPEGVWHPEYESIETLIVSDRYEMGIFLIRFPFADAKHFDEEEQWDTLDVIKKRSR
jgi:hypothetical protein